MTCKRVLVLDYSRIEKVSILVVDSHINAGWQLQRKTAVWNSVYWGYYCLAQTENTQEMPSMTSKRQTTFSVRFVDNQKRIFRLSPHRYEVSMSRSYRMDGSDLESRWRRDLPHTDPETQPSSCKMGTGSLSHGVKLPGIR